MDEPLDIVDRPPIRQEFLTLTQARRALSRHPKWQAMVRGDLQMHTVWSDGSARAAEMAHVAIERGYSYIAITDHTKGLRIANGLDERQLIQQRHEIDTANQKFADSGACFIILRSAEVNLSPFGEPDISPDALSELDLVLGSFHSALRRTEDQTERYLAALRNKNIHILGHPQPEFPIIERVCAQIGIVSLPRLRALIKLSRSMAMLIDRISE